MGKINVKLDWKQNMLFKFSDSKGNCAMMDTVPAVGGQDSAPAPKAFVLAGLGGCTAMDVISILRKMRELPVRFEVEVESELTDEHPKMFTKFTIVYKFWGHGLNRAKVEKAVSLSQERYCGVSATFAKCTEIEHRIEIFESDNE